MIVQNDSKMIKNLLQNQAGKFNENIELYIQNEHRSPIFEIYIKVSYNVGPLSALWVKFLVGASSEKMSGKQLCGKNPGKWKRTTVPD